MLSGGWGQETDVGGAIQYTVGWSDFGEQNWTLAMTPIPKFHFLINVAL